MALDWIAWAIFATVIWGLGTFAAKPATDRLGPKTMGLGATLVEGVAFGLVGLLLPRGPLTADPGIVLAAVSAGTLGAVGYIFFYEGMRLGSVGLVGTISAAAPMLTVVLSVLFLRETLGMWPVVGIGLMMLCILLLAYEPKRRDASRRTAVALSLLGFFVWGLWGFLVKTSVDVLGQGNLDILLAMAYLGVTAGYAAVRRKPPAPADPPSRRIWSLGLCVFLSGALGAIGLTVAYDLGPAALVGPVSGTYPVIATLGAAAFLRERLTWRVAVALVAFVLGIALLSAV
jgi:transporter family protein